jgi:prevent-host-death family protein
MSQITIHTAKTHLSRLIQRACDGEEIVIAKGKMPMVRLVPVDAPKPKRQFGALKGKITLDDCFFEPLPNEELDAWEGK